MYFCTFHACFECKEGQRQKRDHSKPLLGQNCHYLLSLLRSVHYSIGIAREMLGTFVSFCGQLHHCTELQYVKVTITLRC